MGSQWPRVSSLPGTKDSWAKMSYSLSHSTAQACQWQQLRLNWLEKFSQGKQQEKLLTHHRPSLKSCSLFRFPMERSQNFRTHTTGPGFSLLKENWTYKSSASLPIGDVLSLLRMRIPSTTPLLNGSSISWRSVGTSYLARGTPSSQREIASLVPTTTGQRERVSTLKNTPWLRSSALRSPQVWSKSFRTKRYTWSLPPWGLRLWPARPMSSCCPKASMVSSPWRTMSTLFALLDLLGTWHSKVWPKKTESMSVFTSF